MDEIILTSEGFQRHVKVKRSLIPSWSSLHCVVDLLDLCWSSRFTPLRFTSMWSYSCRHHQCKCSFDVCWVPVSHPNHSSVHIRQSQLWFQNLRGGWTTQMKGACLMPSGQSNMATNAQSLCQMTQTQSCAYCTLVWQNSRSSSGQVKRDGYFRCIARLNEWTSICASFWWRLT